MALVGAGVEELDAGGGELRGDRGERPAPTLAYLPGFVAGVGAQG
jgi:hypothetical protein